MTASLKTLTARGFAPEQAKAIRALMDNFTRKHPYGVRPVHTLEKINDIMGGYGVEYIPAGSGSCSPAIEYVNMGDTYDTTVMWVNGRFRIGCWGDIVERGNYA